MTRDARAQDDVRAVGEATPSDAAPLGDARAGAPEAPDRPRDDRWQRVRDVLVAALDHDTREREAFFERECAGDPALGDEVRSLLAAHDRSGVVDRLTAAVIAPIVARARLQPDGGDWSGRAVAHYVVGEKVGGGGMGVLYRARDTRLDRTVALKFLPPHLGAAPSAKERFFLEARAAAALEHPNVCTIHEIGETPDGQLYIAMPLYDGETVERRIARGPLAVDHAITIALQMARGLAAAHDAGIVHRDVKPSNAMLLPNGGLKLLDFGIAKVGDVSLTGADARVGTVSYMSPEQARGEPVDRRSDVWSLGVVLYEMLAGVRPFRGESHDAVVFAILAGDVEPLAARRDDVPAELEAVIHHALRRSPHERYASMTELASALTAAMSSVSAPATEGAGAPPAEGTRTRRPARRSFAGNAAGASEVSLPPAGERREVTVLVSLVSGYDALVERLTVDSADRLLARVRNIAVDVVREHGGVVNQTIGDDIVSLFGVPAAHEDDVVRAARAALALHTRVRELRLTDTVDGGLRLQSGAHTGSVVVRRLHEGPRRFAVTGGPAQRAARLAALAAPDALLVGPESQRLLAPYFSMERTEARADDDGALYRVVHELGLATRLEAAERTGGGLTPYAGRDAELGALERQFELASRGEGRIAVVAGEAGAGKSRMLHELRRRVGQAPVRVLQGRCRPHGGSAPYVPFIEVLRAALDLTARGASELRSEEVAERVVAIDASLEELVPLYLHLLSIQSEAYPVPRHLHGMRFHASMLEALAALFTRLATRAPVLLLLEDWHWVDDASRDVLRHLAAIVPAFAVLVVVTCRPEGGVELGATSQDTRVQLGPLDAGSALALMKSVLRVDRLPEVLASRVYQRTGGNPFFLEEVCQTLLKDGLLVVRDGEAKSIAPIEQLQLPHTVQAVIRSRLDRLDPEAREVLRVASVIGREFSRRVLERALDAVARDGGVSGAGGDPTRALERLGASGLIQQTSVVPAPLYRFKHVLTQEVTYDSLLEHQRVVLHREVGRAIEQVFAAHLDEHVDLLAQHFARAGEWRTAVRYGIRASTRAEALSQYHNALGALEDAERWLLQLPDDEGRREALADLLLRQERLCETLGQRERQQQLIDALVALLAPYGSSARLAETYLRQGDVHTLLKDYDAADRTINTALRMSRERADLSMERNALRSMGFLRWHEGRPAEALAYNEQALRIDRERDDDAAVIGDLANIAILHKCLGAPERAIECLNEVLAMPALEADPFKRAFVQHNLAMAYRTLGNVHAALERLQVASVSARGRRLAQQDSFHLTSIASIHLELGQIEKALAVYGEAVELGRTSGNADGQAHALQIFGEVLTGLQRDADALPKLQEAATLFAQLEDRSSEAALRHQVALLLERTGDYVGAGPAWQAALALRRRLGDRRGELDAREGIARAARRSGTPPAETLALHEAAAALAQSLGEGRREASLRNTMGIVSWEGGAYADALRQYETALRLLRELDGDGRDGEGLILNSLGVTLHRLRRYEEARTALEEGIVIHRATGARQQEAHAHAALGDIYRDLARPTAAQHAYEQSLALRVDIGDVQGEVAMRDRLARIAAERT